MSCSSGENVSFLRGHGGRTPGERRRLWVVTRREGSEERARRANLRVPRCVARTLVQLCIAVIACTVAEARPIEIASHARVDLAEESEGLTWTVSGTLRDDNGVGLPFRRVRIDFHGDGDGLPERSDEVRTDRGGTFAAAHRLPAGAWRAEVRFEGDAFVDAVAAEIAATLEPVTPSLRVDAPRTIDARVDRFPLRVEVAGSPDLSVLATADCFDISGSGAEREAFVRDDAGLRCTLVAEAAVASGFAAREDVAVRRVEGAGVALTLDATFASSSPFLPGAWTLSGQARDTAGPIHGARIVWMQRGSGAPGQAAPARNIQSARALDSPRDRELASALTDADGVAVAQVPGDDVRDGELFAVLRVDVPGDLALATSGTLSVARPGRALDWVPRIFAGVVLLAIIGVATLMRRPRRAARVETPALPAPRPPRAELIVVPSSDDASTGVQGRAFDAELEIPLRCQISWPGGQTTSDAEGCFALPSLPPSTRVNFAAPGFRPLATSVPNHGRVRIRLRPYRVDVLDAWRDVVRAHRPDGVNVDRWWGRRVLGDVRERVARVVQTLRRAPQAEPVERREYAAWLERTASEATPVEAVEALGRMVEHAYFGAEVTDAETVAQAKRLAASALAPHAAHPSRADEALAEAP